MGVFLSTLNQIAFLFTLIAAGYILAKLGILPEGAAKVLAKLENTIFIPALVLGTFIENFTVERLASAWKLLVVSTAIAIVMIPVSILVSKAVTRDKYIQNIYTYGLAFSNFGFMGNAVVSAMFPDIFFEYLLFTLPLWVEIYVWGVPVLLMGDTEKQQTLKDRVKPFINPMFISMLIGIVIGLLKIPMPSFFVAVLDSSSACMSPVAMLLTGITVSTISFKKTFTDIRTYIISFVRLLALPLAFIGISLVVPVFKDKTILTCALCSLAMPLGLNTIVIPSAYGKDTTVAAGMAVISHLMALASIPLIFAIAGL
ncbi:MAG: AEC family transporter [Clostridia bacterium]|nr:AEC family transporter [Clostridia bacterium]